MSKNLKGSLCLYRKNVKVSQKSFVSFFNVKESHSRVIQVLLKNMKESQGTLCSFMKNVKESQEPLVSFFNVEESLSRVILVFERMWKILRKLLCLSFFEKPERISGAPCFSFKGCERISGTRSVFSKNVKILMEQLCLSRKKVKGLQKSLVSFLM